jgi:hypothetical protein
VVDALDAGEELLRRTVGLVVAIVVLEDEDVGGAGDDDAGAEDADAEGGVDIVPLVEGLFAVGGAVAVGVFEDDDAIALGAARRPHFCQTR